MGRSVSHPSGAIVAYRDCSEIEDSWEFAELIDDLREQAKATFPSFTSCDTWLDREDHAIAENGFAWFGVSEYCGLVAIWLVAKDFDSGYSDDNSMAPLADRWLQQVEKRFLATFGEFRKVGTMSNGEGVYQRT